MRMQNSIIQIEYNDGSLFFKYLIYIVLLLYSQTDIRYFHPWTVVLKYRVAKILLEVFLVNFW